MVRFTENTLRLNQVWFSYEITHLFFFAQGNVLKTKFSDLDVDKDGHITESDLQKVKRAHSALGQEAKS